LYNYCVKENIFLNLTFHNWGIYYIWACWLQANMVLCFDSKSSGRRKRCLLHGVYWI